MRRIKLVPILALVMALAAIGITVATAGSTGAILLLLCVFGFFFRRSERLKRENDRLLATSRHEALTDPLTGLGNRRALLKDLESRAPRAGGDEALLFGLFDLDGFKQYNDTFGHPAGDALLGASAPACRPRSPGRGRPTAWEATSSACSSTPTGTRRRSC